MGFDKIDHENAKEMPDALSNRPVSPSLEEPPATNAATPEEDTLSWFERLQKRRNLLITLAAIITFASILTTQSWIFLPLLFSAIALVATQTSQVEQWLGLKEEPSKFQPTTMDDEEQLLAMRQSFQTIVSALPDPTILLTKDGNLILFNTQASELLGNLQAGRHISSVIRNPEFLDAIARASEAARPLTVYYSARVPMDRRISTVITKIPAKNDQTDAPRLLATFKDLTQLERINQMRADFITNASHELRTPIASLTGFIETLQGPAKDDPEARDRFLSIMAAQTERMKRLINDLLSLSRVEMVIHLRPDNKVDMNEVISYVSATLEPLAVDAGIALTTNLPTESYFVRGERDELVQVIQNLVQNAIHYGHKNGHVDVSLERQSQGKTKPATISVTVADDGPGIAPEHIPRLTERFYRVDVTSSRDKGGTGLGLAITKHIVTRHRGELTIHSRPGDGSKFKVSLNEWPKDKKVEH